MPDTRRVRSRLAGGALQGGAPRAVWLTTDSDPALDSAQAVAHRLDTQGLATHLVWNPLTGEVAQLLPATAAAPWRLTFEGTDRSREGRVCVTVAVVAYTTLPFTDGPLTGITRILDWLDSWRVPRSWPPGPPSADPGAPAPKDGGRLWALGGHFGYSQVPGSTARGPGAIDPAVLLGPKPPTAHTPARYRTETARHPPIPHPVRGTSGARAYAVSGRA
ncbi:hypothetical protein [Murinocardiopsis flavida]|nr:hypothetical protein [Murinocardiopsis flavida]